MRIESGTNTNPLQKTKGAPHEAPQEPTPRAAQAGKVAGDSAQLSTHAQEALDEGHHEAPPVAPDSMREIAHRAHNPHGALHVLEAGEHGIGMVARLARGGRAVAAVAEASEVANHAQHHAGLVHRFEHGVEKLLGRTGNWLSTALGKLPGGSKVVNGVKAVFGAPGRAAGAAARAADTAIAGSRVGNALRFSGSAGRFVANAGGRIPVVGSVLGGVIAAVDVKDALHTLKDPHATTGQKVIAGSQGLLSGASGVLGLGALGVAGAAAIGLTAPVSVPLLLGAATLTGVGAFALSFFKKHE